MSTYILIMTLAFGSGGAAIHSVGFDDLDLCRSAGNLWLEKAAKTKEGKVRNAICVQTGWPSSVPVKNADLYR